MSDFKALVVGVSKYNDTSIRELPNVVNDLLGMGQILNSSNLNYSKHMKLIFNQDATKDNIWNSCNEFFNNCSPDDTLFFYWAGHGSGGGYLIAYDTNSSKISSSAIPMDSIRGLIEKSPAKSIVSFFDCCYSGAIARSLNNLQESISRALKIEGQGKIIITACTEYQEALERNDMSHGRFTFHLLEGLNGTVADSNGEVNVFRLYEYISEKMRSYPQLQRPVFFGRLTDPIVINNTSGRDFIGLSENKPISNYDIGESIHNNAIVIDNSQEWLLINERPLHYVSIVEDGNNLSISFENLSSEDGNFLKKICDTSKDYWNQAHICITYGEEYEEGTAILKTQHCGSSVKHILMVQKKVKEQNHLEMSVGLGCVTISPRDIAELRARRILLSEESSNKFSLSEWTTLNMYVAGLSLSEDKKINKPPLPALLNSILPNTIDDWKKVRLYLVRFLKESNTVKYINCLGLSVINNKLAHIKFEGTRESLYTNQPAERIVIDSSYPS